MTNQPVSKIPNANDREIAGRESFHERDFLMMKIIPGFTVSNYHLYQDPRRD